jgi:hypothetical protein
VPENASKTESWYELDGRITTEAVISPAHFLTSQRNGVFVAFFKNILSRVKMNLSNESAVSGTITTQGVCQTASLNQNQTSLHQMNQQIQAINTSNTNTNQPTFYCKTTYHHAATRALTIMQQPGR